MNQFASLGSRLGWISLTLALGACGALETGKVDYKSAKKGTTLEVPPDLTQLSHDPRYTVSGGAVTASGYQATAPTPATPTTSPTTLGDVRIERAGNQRWLVVNRPADQLWQPVREFWKDNGFELMLDQADLGIMETEWAENRAKLPQDFIRRSVGKVFDSLYSTGERDKFRTRLERNANGGTEIFISHRGMVETYTTSQREQTAWQPRPADPELEAEFLRRLMVKLGASPEQAKTLVAAAPAKPAARVTTVDNQPVVLLDEGFDRAWRRVGLSLDRTGFTVEDRDRSRGLYFVRYVAPDADKKEPGFFSKLFGGAGAAQGPLKYRIQVRSQGESTTVSVLDNQGAPESSANAQRIVQVIADDLK